MCLSLCLRFCVKDPESSETMNMKLSFIGTIDNNEIMKKQPVKTGEKGVTQGVIMYVSYMIKDIILSLIYFKSQEATSTDALFPVLF